MTDPFDAVVLAGGAASRLGGVDKALVTVGDVTLLERVLGAARDARKIVCVGPERATSVPVTWTRERPAGGGPVGALAAGLRHVGQEIVLIAAVDAPFLTDSVVKQLVDACRDDAAMLVDAGGRPQPLMGAYRTGFLRERIGALEEPDGAAVHQVTAGARITLVDDPVAARDIDTLIELEAAREEVGNGRGGPKAPSQR